MTPPRSIATLVLALSLLAGPATAAADEVFEPEDGGVSGVIAAEGGRFLFSGSQEENAPRELFEGFGPGASPLGSLTEADNEAFMDLDLGTDAALRPVVTFTYSYDLYRYDFDTRRTTRLAVSRDRCEEFGGLMQRGVLYFERVRRSARKAVNRCPGGVFAKRPGRPARRLLRTVPPSWDVSNGVVAFETDRVLRKGSSDSTIEELGITEVRVKPIGVRRSRRVAVGRYRTDKRGDKYAGVYFEGVSLDEGFVYWRRKDGGRDGDAQVNDLFRAPARGAAPSTKLSREGRSLEGSSGLPPSTLSYAVDGENIYYFGSPSGTLQAISKVGPGPPRFE